MKHAVCKLHIVEIETLMLAVWKIPLPHSENVRPTISIYIHRIKALQSVTADLQSRSFVIEHRADDDATTNCEEEEGIECLVARIGYYIPCLQHVISYVLAPSH